MKDWLTAREIAAQKLSTELPVTKSGMIRYAADAGWNECLPYCRQRKGRGGGLEYHIALLPPLARIEYERRHRNIERVEIEPAPIVLGSNLTERGSRERDARIAILTAFEAFSKSQRMAVETCLHMFCNQYNAGALRVEPWVKEVIRSISKRTLFRWRTTKHLGRVDALAVDRGQARKGKGVLDKAEGGALRTFVLALIAHNSHLSAAQILTQCRAEFGDDVRAGDKTINLKHLPIRTLQLFMARLKESQSVALTKLSHPDLYRSTMAPAGIGTYRWIDEPNALWMIDASPVDALCVDGRHAIYACVDIATRRLILYVSRTPRASAVGLLIRKAILAWGAPQKIKTDNGSDFVAHETKRLLASLDIEMELSAPYQPQQKGHVERAIRTFQHDCATLLPGFIGHSVADRKRIEDTKSFADRLGQDTADTFGVSLTGPKLQAYVDDWASTIYAHREHSTLKKSPYQAALGATKPMRTVDPAALDVLLMPVAGPPRKVTKFGVRVDNFAYRVDACLPGDRVMVRQDPHDVGRILCFDAETGLFRGEGICAELRGVSAAELLQASREVQAETVDQATREIRAAIKRLTKGPALIERALKIKRGDVPNVIALPKRTEEHSTPAIAAALDAATPKSEPTPISPRAAEILRTAASETPVVVDRRPSNVTPLRIQETRQQRFRRALDVERAMEAGNEIPTEQAVWYGGYSAGSEYRAMRTLYEDGGEQVLR